MYYDKKNAKGSVGCQDIVKSAETVWNETFLFLFFHKELQMAVFLKLTQSDHW